MEKMIEKAKKIFEESGLFKVSGIVPDAKGQEFLHVECLCDGLAHGEEYDRSGIVLKNAAVEYFSGKALPIALELKQVRYCDSTGLSAILTINRLSMGERRKKAKTEEEARAINGIALLGLSDAVERLVTITQLDTVLDIYTDKESLKRGPQKVEETI